MIDQNTAEHTIWGQACDGWHLMKSPGASVIQERMPPGTFETRHLHNQSRQFFFILSGEASLEVNGELQQLSAWQGLEIPPGTPHQIMNNSGAVLEFVVFSCPPSHADRINL